MSGGPERKGGPEGGRTGRPGEEGTGRGGAGGTGAPYRCAGGPVPRAVRSAQTGPGPEVRVRRGRPKNPVHPALPPAAQRSAPRPGPSGFVTGDVPVTRRQRDYVDGLLRAVPAVTEAQRRLFAHVLHSSARDVWAAGGGVPVDARLITALPTAGRTAAAVYGPLVGAGLLTVVTGRYREGLSNTYRVPNHVLDRYVELGLPADPEADPVDVGPLVGLHSGHPTTAVAKTRLRDDNGNPVGAALWTRAMGSVRSAEGLFDAAAVLAHLERLRADVALAKGAWDTAGGEPETEEAWAHRRARLRALNDARCYGALCRQRPTRSSWRPDRGYVDLDLFRYRLAYRHQRSGRAGQVGGALQSCSREMKAAAYGAVPGVRNYDVRASQVNLLAEEFAVANGSGVGGLAGWPLDPAWLDDYARRPGAKDAYAKAVGVSVDTWKTALCAVLMGARLPSPGQGARSDGAVVRALREEGGELWTEDGLEGGLRRLRDALGPLPGELRRWHRWLDDHARSLPNVGGGDRLVPNAAGERYRWSPSHPEHRRRAELAAHLLQGREAAFVLNLILQAERHRFRVLSHEHDGLVTLGAVPRAAVEAAKAAAGVARVVLVEKPFA